MNEHDHGVQKQDHVGEKPAVCIDVASCTLLQTCICSPVCAQAHMHPCMLIYKHTCVQDQHPIMLSMFPCSYASFRAESVQQCCLFTDTHSNARERSRAHAQLCQHTKLRVHTNVQTSVCSIIQCSIANCCSKLVGVNSVYPLRMSRDLIAELELKRASKAMEPKLQPSPKQKAARSSAEHTEVKEKTSGEIELEAAELEHRELDPLIFMAASQEAQDAAVDSECEATVTSLQMINGMAFFCTHMAFNGMSLWKTTESIELAGGPLYLFHVPVKGQTIAGWYIANHLFSSEKEKGKMEADGLYIVAWAEGKGPYPDTFHIPYWAKKPNKGVTPLALWEAYLQVAEQALASRTAVTDMKSQLDTLAVCLDKVIKDEEISEQEKIEATAIVESIELVHEVRQVDEAASDSKGKGKKHDDAEHIDADADEQPKGYGKSGGKKGKTPRQHGGWMPKLAQIAASYLNQDWGYCTRLIDRWCTESKTLSMLVDQKLKK